MVQIHTVFQMCMHQTQRVYNYGFGQVLGLDRAVSIIFPYVQYSTFHLANSVNASLPGWFVSSPYQIAVSLSAVYPG